MPAVLALAGAALVAVGLGRPGPPQPRPQPSTAMTVAGAGATRIPGPDPDTDRVVRAGRIDVPEPVAVDIPRIAVHAAVVPVGRDAEGGVAVPAAVGEAARLAYWYRDLVAPGAVGPAVVVGHVDSRRDGPAVFYRLGELLPGDEVTVRRADASRVRFVVRSVGRYPKAAFPTDTVYGPTPVPGLRLITCGGSFDRDAGSYRDDVVVFADARSG